MALFATESSFDLDKKKRVNDKEMIRCTTDCAKEYISV